jgi:hypothetical protein
MLDQKQLYSNPAVWKHSGSFHTTDKNFIRRTGRSGAVKPAQSGAKMNRGVTFYDYRQ